MAMAKWIQVYCVILIKCVHCSAHECARLMYAVAHSHTTRSRVVLFYMLHQM